MREQFERNAFAISETNKRTVFHTLSTAVRSTHSTLYRLIQHKAFLYVLILICDKKMFSAQYNSKLANKNSFNSLLLVLDYVNGYNIFVKQYILNTSNFKLKSCCGDFMIRICFQHSWRCCMCY